MLHAGFNSTNGLEQIRNIFCFGVIDLDKIRHQWLKFTHLTRRLEHQTLLIGDLLRRCNPDHIALLTSRQSFGLHDRVQRLIPGNILQSQTHIPRNRITDHEIEAGLVSNLLQRAADRNVLKIETDRFAAISDRLITLPRNRFEGDI